MARDAVQAQGSFFTSSSSGDAKVQIMAHQENEWVNLMGNAA